MAQVVLGVAGAVVGSFFGMPQLGYAVGSAIGGLFAPQPHSEGPRLSDRRLTSSVYGNPVPRVYGSYRTAGEVIFALPIREVSTTAEAGKGGGPTQTTYSYFGTFAIALCEGEIAGIRRVWANGELVFDISDTTSSGDVGAPAAAGSTSFLGLIKTLDASQAAKALNNYMTVYTGSESQLPDPTLQANDPNSSAYRGMAYVVFADMPLEKFGNRMPNLLFEVVRTTGADAPGMGLVVAQVPYVQTNEGNYGVGSVDRGDSSIVKMWTATKITSATVNTAMLMQRWETAPGGNARVVDTHYAPQPDGENVANVSAALAAFGCPRGGYGYELNIGGNPALTKGYLAEIDGLGLVNMFTLGTGFANGVGYVQNPVLAHDGVSLAALGGVASRYGSSGGALAPALVYLSDGRTLSMADPVRGLFLESGYLYILTDVGGAGTSSSLAVYNVAAGTTPALAATVNAAGMGPSTPMYVNRGVVYFSQATGGDATTYGLALYKARPLAGDTAFTLMRSWLNTNLLDKNTDTQNRWKPFNTNAPNWMFCDGNVLLMAGEQAPTVGQQPLQFGVIEYTLNRLPQGTQTVGQIVAAECAAAGLDASLIDVSELTDTVVGYQISQRGTGRQALEPMAAYGFFDAVESDWKITFPLRNRAPTVLIPEADMGAADETSTTDSAITWTRVQELELPQEVSVAYADSTSGFAIGAQADRRLVTSSNKKMDVQLPIAMTPVKAATIASRLLYQAWTGRNKAKWSTSQKWAGYMPADAVYLQQGNKQFPIRITRRQDLPSGLIEFEGESVDARVMVQVPDATASGYVAPTVSYNSAMGAKFIDAPLLRDVDALAAPLLYVGALAYRGTWPGGAVFGSDDGLNYAREVDLTAPAHVGSVAVALPDFAQGSAFFDDGNSVSVQFYEAVTLAGVTRTQALSLAVNMAMIGNEVIVFRNASLTGGTTSAPIYTLSGLLRGQKGTEAFTSTHTANEDLVLLDPAAIKAVRLSAAQVNTTRQYKAVTAGRSLQGTAAQAFKAGNAGVKPLAPVFVAAGKNAANDILINWVRRSRVDQAWRDFGDVLLGEPVEAYEIDICTPAGVVQRTLKTSTPGVTYPNAQAVLDFGVTPPNYIVRVYQISSVVGRGYPGVFVK